MNTITVLFITTALMLFLLTACMDSFDEEYTTHYQTLKQQSTTHADVCSKYGRELVLTYTDNGVDFIALCITKSPYTERHVPITTTS